MQGSFACAGPSISLSRTTPGRPVGHSSASRSIFRRPPRSLGTLQEIEQRTVGSSASHSIVGQDEFTEVAAEKGGRRWHHCRSKAGGLRIDVGIERRCLARIRRCSPRANRLLAQRYRANAGRHPDEATRGGRKSASLRDQNCPRRKVKPWRSRQANLADDLGPEIESGIGFTPQPRGDRQFGLGDLHGRAHEGTYCVAVWTAEPITNPSRVDDAVHHLQRRAPRVARNRLRQYQRRASA